MRVQQRERSVPQNSALDSYTPNLRRDREQCIFLGAILDAHVATISRLQWYVTQTFDCNDKILKEMSEDLLTKIGEVEKKMDKQLKARTDNLVDLVFNYVNSQDSHVSAEIGMSMWRLSWITFVFLPLTFLAGIFGINVESFADAEHLYIK